MYHGVVAFLPIVIETLFWGAYSDKHGRRALMWVPCLSNILYLLALIVWIKFSLPLEFIFVLSFLKPTGALGTVITGAYATLTYFVEKENRARRFLYVRILFRFTVSASEALSGYIMHFLGKRPIKVKQLRMPRIICFSLVFMFIL